MIVLLQGEAPTSEVAETLVKHRSLHPTGPLPGIPYLAKADAHRLDTLEVVGLTAHYPETDNGAMTRHGIGDISFKVKRGDFTVITGRIGSGKTTLLRALLGLLPKDAGEIRWNGKAIEDPASFFVPPRSAHTAQVPLLLSESLRDNILMGLPREADKDQPTADLQTAIWLAVMEEDIGELENGLETIIGPRGVKLWGGQAQRAAAARWACARSRVAGL